MRKSSVITAAAPEDAPILASIQFDCRIALDLKFGLDLGSLFPDRNSLVRIWSARMLRKKAKIYCCREEGAGSILGFCQRGLDECNDIHISALYVKPSSWRRGIGEKLLKKIFSDAAKEHSQRIWLEVLAANAVAKNFYAKFGFSPEPSCDRVVRAGEKYFQFNRMIYRI